MLATLALQCGLLVAAVDQARRTLIWSANAGCGDQSLVAWLQQHNESKHTDVLRRWLELTRGTMVGECVAFGGSASPDAEAKQDPAADWRSAFRSRQYVLQGLMRMTSVFTLLAIIIEMSWGLAGGSGIEALQAGLPQRLAFRNVLTSLALGFVTLGVAVWANRVLQARAANTRNVLRQIAALSERDVRPSSTAELA